MTPNNPPNKKPEGDWAEWDRAMEQDDLVETGRMYSHWLLKIGRASCRERV